MTLSFFCAVACGSDSQVLGKRARGGEGGEGDASGTGGAVGGSVQPQGGTLSGAGGSNGGSSGTDAGSSGEGGGGAVTTGGTSGRGGNAGTGVDGGQSGEGGSGKSGAGGTSAGAGGATAGAGGSNGGAGAGAGGASSGAGGGGATATCGEEMCGAGQFCIAYRTLGGAVTPPDAGGNCPSGTHVENMYCLPNFSYTCGVQTSCTGDQIDCACAASACPSTHRTCRAPIASSFLDPNARLLCELLGG